MPTCYQSSRSGVSPIFPVWTRRPLPQGEREGTLSEACLPVAALHRVRVDAQRERGILMAELRRRVRDVVTDRFAGSSLAYQGFGRGLDVEEVRRLSTWAADGLEADLVVLLEVPLDIAARRRTAADDRMEAEGAAFHARVADGYRALAAAQPDRWVVVDGDGPPGDVAERVSKVVADKLGTRP